MQTFLAQGAHTEFDRLLAENDPGGALVDHLTQRVVESQGLVDRAPAPVARVIAFGTAAAFIELLVADFVGGKTEERQLVLGGLVGLNAARADATDKTLRHDQFERGGNKERLHAHIDKAGDCAGRVVGVERGEDQVAGEGGLDGDLRGF